MGLPRSLGLPGGAILFLKGKREAAGELPRFKYPEVRQLSDNVSADEASKGFACHMSLQDDCHMLVARRVLPPAQQDTHLSSSHVAFTPSIFLQCFAQTMCMCSAGLDVALRNGAS